MKKILLFGLAMLATANAMAFGGSGSSRKSALYRGTGVDSIGVHFGGGSQGETPTPAPRCPKHSTLDPETDKCICDEGYVEAGDFCFSMLRNECVDDGYYWCASIQACVENEDACPAYESELCGGEGVSFSPEIGGMCTQCPDDSTPYIEGDYEVFYAACCPKNKELTTYHVRDFWGPRYYYGVDSVVVGTCCPADQVSYYGGIGDWIDKGCCDLTTHTLVQFDSLSACCEAENTPYCQELDQDGKCSLTGCCWDEYEAKPVEGAEGLSVCADPNSTTYCASMYPNGTCRYGSYCESGMVVKSIENGPSACCNANENAYCSYYNEDGSCRNATCCAGEPEYNGNSVCCKKNWGNSCWTTSNDVCAENQTPYCRVKKSDGSCAEKGCCDSGKQVHAIGDAEACCAQGATPYCEKKRLDGTCTYANCCSSNRQIQTVGNVEACCSSNETPYCGIKYADGTCSWTGCCSNSQTVRTIDIASNCCDTSATPYCHTRHAGLCTYVDCCESGRVVKTLDGFDRCCRQSENLYCMDTNADGTCRQMECCYNYTEDDEKICCRRENGDGGCYYKNE